LAHSVLLCLQSIANEHVNRVAYAGCFVIDKVTAPPTQSKILKFWRHLAFAHCFDCTEHFPFFICWSSYNLVH